MQALPPTPEATRPLTGRRPFGPSLLDHPALDDVASTKRRSDDRLHHRVRQVMAQRAGYGSRGVRLYAGLALEERGRRSSTPASSVIFARREDWSSAPMSARTAACRSPSTITAAS